jgi:rhamnosyltransferase
MPGPRTPPRVLAVVVTYEPVVENTARLLTALRPQVAGIVVVDNGSAPARLHALRSAAQSVGASLVALESNRGVAAAQNLGIAWIRERGAEFALLFDQDSLPAPDMVDRLLDGYARAHSESNPVAGVGPITVDERSAGAPLLFESRRWGPRRADVPSDDGALVPVTFLLASGCLIPVEALDAIGPMKEEWFIDHIDLEWGLRAAKAGLAMYGVVGARLQHSLGDSTVHIPGRARNVHIHSPVRNYYMTRNTVLLARSGLMRPAWRLGYALWIVKYAVFYTTCQRPRLRRLSQLMRGLADGLTSHTGPR